MSHIISSLTLLTPSPYLPLSERRGNLPFTLMNDYMFKAVLQTDETVLRSLLCGLLDLASDDIRTIVIKNALVLGTTIDSKDTILDIRIALNSRQIVNIEMQIRNEQNWPERSLYYLCRAFSNLESGAVYLDVKPAHHIGILDFSLPRLQKQFYSHYLMINETTHEIFSDQFRLSILDLTQTALATEHDRQSGLTRWAAAFKATTWEEYQMLAAEDSIFEKVSDALYLLSQNREVAEQCLRMQEAEAVRKYRENQEKQREEQMAQQKEQMAQQKELMAQQEAQIAEMKNTLAEQESELEQLRAQLRKYQEQPRQD